MHSITMVGTKIIIIHRDTRDPLVQELQIHMFHLRLRLVEMQRVIARADGEIRAIIVRAWAARVLVGGLTARMKRTRM